MDNLLERYHIDLHSLPSLPLVPSSCNRYGFDKLDPSVNFASSCSELSDEDLLVEQKRLKKWKVMLESWKETNKRPRKLNERVYKGVPLDIRKQFWMLLLKETKEETKENIDKLCFINTPTEYDSDIDIDVRRTMAYHYLFKKDYCLAQRELFLILRGWAQKEPDVGYIQGMTDFSGFMFSVLMDRYLTFNLLEMVMVSNKFNMKHCYEDGLVGLREFERINNLMIKNVHHKVHKHIVSLGYNDLSTPSFLFEWYLAWFSRILPRDFSYSVFDFCLLDGVNALYTIGSTIIHFIKEDILGCYDLDLIIQMMKNPSETHLKDVNYTTFFKWCYEHKVTDSTIEKWSKRRPYLKF